MGKAPNRVDPPLKFVLQLRMVTFCSPSITFLHCSDESTSRCRGRTSARDKSNLTVARVRSYKDEPVEAHESRRCGLFLLSSRSTHGALKSLPSRRQKLQPATSDQLRSVLARSTRYQNPSMLVYPFPHSKSTIDHCASLLP